MSSPFFILFSAIFFLASFPTLSLSQCISFGDDIGDGSTNYINPNSGAEFSYQGGFQGCIAETCTTTLQTAEGTTLDCSSVSTTQIDYESVCLIQHSQMTPGAYTIFLTCPDNGILFGREFFVVNTQATSTSTVTATVTGTVTPVSTFTSVSTSTEVDTTTLPPQITTLPSATADVSTIHPQTTITRTKTIVHTTMTAITTSETITKSAHARCTSVARTPDGKSRVAASITSSTFASSALTFAASTTTSASSTMAARRAHPRDFGQNEILSGRNLVKRVGPDGPLTTTITVSASPVIVLNTISPASTITIPSLTVVVSTSTVTPSVQTVFSGSVASTVTAPVTTKITTVRLQETTTEIVTRTIRFVVTAASAVSAC